MPASIEHIRFHLDENVDPAVADILRRAGIDVTTTQEAQLLHQSDLSQLDYARLENRMLVTHDEDFLVIANLSTDHPGIAYCHIRARTLRQITDALVLIHAVLTSDEVRGKVEYI
jgi:predicted nuclease of predicted toxin-antitoxin system